MTNVKCPSCNTVVFKPHTIKKNHLAVGRQYKVFCPHCPDAPPAKFSTRDQIVAEFLFNIVSFDIDEVSIRIYLEV